MIVSKKRWEGTHDYWSNLLGSEIVNAQEGNIKAVIWGNRMIMFSIEQKTKYCIFLVR